MRVRRICGPSRCPGRCSQRHDCWPCWSLLLGLPSSALAQLVTQVVDGDTIVVAGVGTVRLIGVDTPETVDPRKPVQFFGKEASEFTRRMAQGKVVRLEFDARGRTSTSGRWPTPICRRHLRER